MQEFKILIGSDHGGYELKNKIYTYLKEKKYNIEDIGTHSTDSCDYPFYAQKAAKAIQNNEAQRAILVCGTGIGMQIAANRFKGVRAACVSDFYSARLTREHNDSNILTLGARIIAPEFAYEIVDIWLNTEFQGGRHINRINMLEQ